MMLPECRPPASLLLATDLSARCDRALDRALILADDWKAELIVFNAIDLPAMPDQVLDWAHGGGEPGTQAERLREARHQLDRAIRGRKVSAAIQQMTSGEDPSDLIRKVADGAQAGMVVTGSGSNERFGRFLLGSTVTQLAKSLSQPLLVVRERPHGAYQRIVVATDFSDASRDALETASRCFQGQPLILYHARQAPLSALGEGAEGLAAAHNECMGFLAGCGQPRRPPVQPVIERGPVHTLLASYVRRNEIDLVVMGSRGRSGLLGMLLGSTAAQLLEWLPCDTLIVPGAGAPKT